VHVDARHVARRGQVHRAGHQRDLRAGLGAARAMAKPILPLEWLVMPRTGSMASKVGPAVTSTLRPASSLGWKKAISSSHSSVGFEHAAVADLAAGLVARAGPSTGTVGAQLRHVALRGRVGPHLAVHRRGHQQRAALGGRARHSRLSSSSARPWASLAMKSALAGATSIASASRDRLMCAMLLGSRVSHWLV
jgi:hypothetical protein